MPYSSPMSTSLARFASVWCSCLVPTKIEMATAATLSRRASSKAVVMVSLLRVSPTMLVPPDTRSTTGPSHSGGTEVRSTPRVIISASA